jgi:hypothetical protein
MRTRAPRRAGHTGATTGTCLYLAFELGVDEWKLGFATASAATARVRTMPAGQRERLAREIAAARQWFGVPEASPVRRSIANTNAVRGWSPRRWSPSVAT